ncbi:concanavalin A-like lectin/glucanase superfamily protein [Phage DSL-LC04]|nr:concanavalin A-like lectin/glucanase superfamily protein [Phage DSL-LC04]
MSLRYPGGLITKSPTAPTTSAAKGVWTLEQALQYIKAGTWPLAALGDPYFQYNTMLLPGQGTNGAQNNTFLDSSTNNFTITRNGNTTQGTFTPFSGTDGYWGMYNSGSSYLSIADNAAFNLSGTPFTIEAWVYHVADSGAYTNWVVGKRGTGSPFTSVWALSISSTNFVEFGTTGYTWGITSSFPIQRNTWNHIAGTYDGTSVRLYVNGVLAAGPTAATVSDVGAAVTIGNYTVGANPVFTGFISNLRIVKGTAVYTSNFTPSTAPLTAVSGTSLLTCQSNRFVDNSTNAFAITVNSTPQITPFQPFGAPTTAYSASTIGGSGYFDGSGDYLTIANNNAFAFGTGNFTVECWVYPTSYTGGSADVILSTYQNGTVGWTIAIGTGGGVFYCAAAGDTQVIASSVAPSQQWFHLAMVRSGTTLAFFVNGVRAGTLTDSTNITSTTELSIGTNTGGGALNFIGYMSGARIVKGTAVYDPTQTTLTIPTAPLTAITNTSALLNYTNAGIIDNAQKNNLETVGNAQISTTQYKWGASSMYFDGTGDYLMMRNTENLTLGTGDFTIEFWVYYNSGLTADVALFDCRPASTAGVYPLIYSNTTGKIVWYINSAARITGTTTLTTNTWYHVAVMRTGGSTKLFINGNQDGSTYADTNNYLLGTNRPVIGAAGATLGADPLNGYIADLRITKGYARYPYNFTAPTAAFPLFYQAAATPSSDPYFDYTTLLLPGNGTNGAQNNTFLDSSTNNFSITRNGNTTQGTFTPFSQTGWSNYFDGTGDYLTAADNAALNFSTGDFTIEGWFYLAGYNGSSFIAKGVGGTSGYGLGISTSGNKYSLFLTSLGEVIVSGSTAVLNTWTHVAVTRSGSTIRLFVNGVVEGTYTSSADLSSTELQKIGISRDDSALFNGYISNVRLVKGTAVYTSAFTVPTSPLTAVSGTSLLTCQSNRFIDNSTNAFTITRNGDTSVQAFSPFNPTAAYSTSTVGGSGYFDGSGDYLTYSPSTSNQFGTGSFTVEAWYYPLSTPTGLGAAYIYDARTASVLSTWILGCRLNGTGVGNLLGWFNGSATLEGSALTVNAWNHVVYVRNSGTNTGSLFLNGTRTATQTDTTNYSSTGATATIGSRYNNTDFLNGYLQDLRIVKGTAVYDASATSITIPTAPLTAITNTSLLTNFTNGAITDATAKNDLETVGNASISTAVSKFGGSSMYFDGNGDELIDYDPVYLNSPGSGDWTFECWVYLNALPGAFSAIYHLKNDTSTATTVFVVEISSTGKLSLSTGIATIIDGTAGLLTTGSWIHIAVTRYSGTFRTFINGVQDKSVANTTTYNGTYDLFGVWKYSGSTNYLNAYMQDVRITKGIARYTTNFTPPTTAFLTL